MRDVMREILVVVDMQNDFISGCLGTKEAVKIVPDVVRLVEDFDGEVVFTRDTHALDYYETAEAKKLHVRHCVRGSSGWEICRELQELSLYEDARIFNKGTFGSTKLAAYLASQAEDFYSVTLCGLCTDICVISNALLIKAFLPEVPIYVAASCCAGTTPTAHERALKSMRACHINILK